eukprot:TRINITY_DN3751_c0_g1_i4.p1 TRINITY_DN3751_c0_g1~~TRINITY_DN3751_c0_g1_i4.p1  ORF type:complete len:227 (+),score=26.41 TRINITY_DN3751_c0_g1_i4:98-778(+)
MRSTFAMRYILLACGLLLTRAGPPGGGDSELLQVNRTSQEVANLEAQVKSLQDNYNYLVNYHRQHQAAYDYYEERRGRWGRTGLLLQGQLHGFETPDLHTKASTPECKDRVMTLNSKLNQWKSGCQHEPVPGGMTNVVSNLNLQPGGSLGHVDMGADMQPQQQGPLGGPSGHVEAGTGMVPPRQGGVAQRPHEAHDTVLEVGGVPGISQVASSTFTRRVEELSEMF